MPFVEDNDVIERIAAAATDRALSDTVLPWATKAGPFGLDAEALRCIDHFVIELRAAIKDQVAGSRVVWECLAQLVNDPGARRMFGNVAVEDSPSVMRNDEKQ